MRSIVIPLQRRQQRRIHSAEPRPISQSGRATAIQPIRQSLGHQSTNQPNQPEPRPISQAAKQPARPTEPRPISPISMSHGQSANQHEPQSHGHSANQPIRQRHGHSTNQPKPRPISQSHGATANVILPTANVILPVP